MGGGGLLLLVLRHLCVAILTVGSTGEELDWNSVGTISTKFLEDEVRVNSTLLNLAYQARPSSLLVLHTCVNAQRGGTILTTSTCVRHF